MSFINNNQKINNRNNFYYLRQGNNYNTPFKINNNNYLNYGQNIQNNINSNYLDTLNKFETKQNKINENNYSPFSYGNNIKNNNIIDSQINNYNYRNYGPYAQYDPYNSNLNQNQKFKKQDNFHYFAQNNNNFQQKEKTSNNDLNINNIGRIILSTESTESLDKQNKNKAKREYSEYLKQQIEEKNKRKKLEREKLLEEDLRLEKENKEYLKRQKEELEKEREKENNKRKNNLPSFNSDKKPINNQENKKFLIDTDINKNIMENMKRAQTPLMYDHIKLNQEISNKYNNKNNFEINDIYKNNININNNNNNSIRRPVSSTIIQSGKGIIDGKNIEYNKRSTDILNNNINNKNTNIENNIINNYSKYKFGDLYKDIDNEVNTISNNKYMNYNTTNRNTNNTNINYNFNKEINNANLNLNETLFNREQYNINNNMNNSNNKYIPDYTFKKTEETEEKPFVINESLKGGSIEEILDLNNKIKISRSFENKTEDDNHNIKETFGSNKSNKIIKDNESNKANYESINSNFTFGNNSQLQNKNNFGVDSIIKNINIDALNYFSKYENNNEENNNNKNEINLEESMKSVSKLISPSNKVNLFSSWKKNNSINENEAIKEEIVNENDKEEKEFILNNNNKDLFITFGEIPKESIKLENNLAKNTLKNNTGNDLLESEGICNFYKETKKIKNEDVSNRVNEALKDAKESSDEDDNNKEINKINFFEDTIGKIKKKASNDIININDRQKLDMIISGEIEDIDTFKSGENYQIYK